MNIKPIPRKHVPLKREIMDGSGIYALYPFDSGFDQWGRGVFKIGMTTCFQKRVHGYDTALPQGVYTAVLYRQPTQKRKKSEKDKNGEHDGLARYYTRIEHEIYKDICSTGGHPITMDIRDQGGKTEWVLATEKCIFNAFFRAEAKYGGDVDYMDLNHLPLAIKEKPVFVGSMNFY